MKLSMYVVNQSLKNPMTQRSKRDDFFSNTLQHFSKMIKYKFS